MSTAYSERMEAFMAADYDLVVIGSGSAARTVTQTCADADWRVAIIDHRPLGGTCVLRGCDPKKALISGAGVDGAPGIDWPALMRFQRGFTEGVPESQAQRYARLGIDRYNGTAVFTGERSLRVGGSEVTARNIVIAAGAEPVRLPIAGAEHLIDSTAFLELDRLPSGWYSWGAVTSPPSSRTSARTRARMSPSCSASHAC